MKRKHCKLASILLTLAVLAATALPVSAHGGCCRHWWNFRPCCQWTYTQPTTPTQPETPVQPDTPTQPETPAQPETGSASSLERQVAALVNQERAAYGLPALTLSMQLCDGARLKSQDMQKNRYFDHNSPTYGTPFEMMRSLGITYAAAGENIAMGFSTAEAVVNAWMNSPGHRANILSENYTHIGVGYVASGGYWTQWFTR